MDFLIITASNVWCLHQRKNKDNDDLQTEFATQQKMIELGVKLFIVPRTYETRVKDQEIMGFLEK